MKFLFPLSFPPFASSSSLPSFFLPPFPLSLHSSLPLSPLSLSLPSFIPPFLYPSLLLFFPLSIFPLLPSIPPPSVPPSVPPSIPPSLPPSIPHSIPPSMPPSIHPPPSLNTSLYSSLDTSLYPFLNTSFCPSLNASFYPSPSLPPSLPLSLSQTGDDSHPSAAVEDILVASDKLRDLDLDAFAEELERQVTTMYIYNTLHILYI